MDPWHWDSVAYTGVILLNDFNDFVGGELECMRMEKRRALKELARFSNLMILILYTVSVTVNYFTGGQQSRQRSAHGCHQL